MTLVKNISIYAKRLSKTELDILNRLLKMKTKVTKSDFTVAKLATLMNVSSTTLFRMTKKLDYSSFVYFKNDYFDNVENSFQETNSSTEYLKMVTQTAELVNQSFSVNMLHHILEAKKIIIYGMGINFYIAHIFQIKLRLLNFNVEVYDDSRFMRLSSRTMNPTEDVVIVLSKSGNPPELIEALAEVNLRHVYTLLITERLHSPIAGLASDIIRTEPSHDSDNDIDTRINMHIALDIIAKQIIDYLWFRKDS